MKYKLPPGLNQPRGLIPSYMSKKRFTDTAKWSTKFMRKLPSAYKLLWLYIQDECDHSGVWIVDLQVAEIKLSISLKEKEALSWLGTKVLPFDNGEKWFIPEFIMFQYGELNPENRAHQSVIVRLKSSGITKVYEEYIKAGLSLSQEPKQKEAPKKVVASPIQPPSKGLNIEEAVIIQTELQTTIGKFYEFRKKIRKPMTDRAKELLEIDLTRLAGSDEDKKVKILNKSILRGWAGVFELTEDNTKNNGYNNTANGLANTDTDYTG